MATCGISISNLKEMINEAVILGRNLRKLWQDGGIARHPGDLVLIKKGVSSLFEPKSLSAERVLQISNLGSLDNNETDAFAKSTFRFSISDLNGQEPAEFILRDLKAINNLLFYLER